MIHLIDKVYLCLDSIIDTNKDRIVVSKENGYQMHEVIDHLSTGILYKYGTSISEVFEDSFRKIIEEVIEFSKSRNRPFYIFADKKNLIQIQILWFKLILKSPNVQDCYNIHESNAFRYNLFQKSFYATNTQKNYSTSFEMFSNEYNKIKDFKETEKKSFCLKYIESLGVEYILATYCYSGKFKTQLKKSISKLLRKNLDDILLEYKGIFLGFYTNKNFANAIKLEKHYSFGDLDIFSDKSKIAEFFLSGRLFKTKELTKATSSGNFRFEKMTEEDHETFRMFTSALGSHFTHNDSIVTYNDGLSPILRDGYKWQFIPCVTGNFTDKILDQLIQLESDIDYPQGSFYNLHLETVNGYLIQHIMKLNKENNNEELKKYILAAI